MWAATLSSKDTGIFMLLLLWPRESLATAFIEATHMKILIHLSHKQIDAPLLVG
jgi:hypothetical protein